MTQTSTKRKKVIIASIIIVVLVVVSIGALIVCNQLNSSQIGLVTVSGQASSGALAEPFPTSIQRIEFTDTQTGAVTTFHFPFTPQSNNPIGNYSVSLKNEHTYSVTISYYHGFPGTMDPESDYITTFTVHAPAGETAITKDFG
jgi:hypothetical protein